MKQFCAIALTQAILVSSTLARNFAIRNNCPFTIWPAFFTNPDSPAQITSQVAGWEAATNTQVSVVVPDGWAGRFWGRRDCDFTKSGPTACVTGGCNGGLVCDAATGTGVPPATLAEFKLNGDGGKDYYDVSNVDGSNLPVQITNDKSCPAPACKVDLNANCPDEKMKVKDSSGATIGCLSACQANLDGNHDDSANCCTGSHNTPGTCPNSGVKYYDYFKKCPDAYAYAYDESSNSALWTCAQPTANYNVTFCP